MGFPFINQRSLIYQFKFDLCDANVLITHGDICINAYTCIRMRPVTLQINK